MEYIALLREREKDARARGDVRVAKRSSRRALETGTETPAPHYSALSQAIASRVDLAQRAACSRRVRRFARAASGDRDERFARSGFTLRRAGEAEDGLGKTQREERGERIP